MSLVRAKDTTPEMTVRQFLHRRGYRYRLHVSGLPGRPDIVFPKTKRIIFVHGCFWHMHSGCRLRLPKSNQDFWIPKLQANRTRDLAVQRKLGKMGWKIRVIWECQLKKPTFAANLEAFLRP